MLDDNELQGEIGNTITYVKYSVSQFLPKSMVCQLFGGKSLFFCMKTNSLHNFNYV